jgi:hypothetical protein
MRQNGRTSARLNRAAGKRIFHPQRAGSSGLGIDAPLNKPDPLTFCGEGARGTTDYPMLADVERA